MHLSAVSASQSRHVLRLWENIFSPSSTKKYIQVGEKTSPCRTAKITSLMSSTLKVANSLEMTLNNHYCNVQKD